MNGDRGKAGHDGRGFRLLVNAYLFWCLVIVAARVDTACQVELLCRLANSGELSTLMMTAPLAIVLASMVGAAIPDDDEGGAERVRLMTVALASAALLLAPDWLGNAAATLAALVD